MNRDEIKGKIDKAKGYAKDKAGELTNDPELEAEGEIERGTGAVREGFGKAKRKVQKGVEDVAEAADDDRR
ncbi:MAG TPA: CsbD family protein [Methylomirabilota bacterium]|nr:CsbD family protein [Methylomirabilota bacterium]